MNVVGGPSFKLESTFGREALQLSDDLVIVTPFIEDIGDFWALLRHDSHETRWGYPAAANFRLVKAAALDNTIWLGIADFNSGYSCGDGEWKECSVHLFVFND